MPRVPLQRATFLGESSGGERELMVDNPGQLEYNKDVGRRSGKESAPTIPVRPAAPMPSEWVPL